MADFKQALIRLTSNLLILREREAKYAGNAPIDLLNQIEDHHRAINLTERARAGQLPESDWRESLRSLMFTSSERRKPVA